VVLAVCPIRYWPLASFCDNTWLFALNYGASKSLVSGRDIAWPEGPLGYLVFPQNVGSNLSHALLFQCAVWIVLMVVFADFFFRGKFPVRNLGAFAFFFGLSAPLFWFDYLGLENLLFAAMVILLLRTHQTGDRARYAAALAIGGVIPLIKLTGGMSVAGAIVGFVAARTIQRSAEVWRDVLLAAIVPAGVFLAGLIALIGRNISLQEYVKANLELAGGYSVAMSLAGESGDFIAAAVTLALVLVYLGLLTKARAKEAALVAFVLAIPMFVSFKHGFVRQDFHIVNFFCFAAFGLALISLWTPLEGSRLGLVFLLAMPYGFVWVTRVATQIGPRAFGEISAVRQISFALRALRFGKLRADLDAESASNYPPEKRLDPEIRSIIGRDPVASLSVIYSSAPLDGLNLELYPVIQRYSVWTPYLDRRNAEWIRSKGPRFLIFDAQTIDERHPWAETPAMWLEIYRWYRTRLSTGRTVLLERRESPRFDHLEPINTFELSLGDSLQIPRSPNDWSSNDWSSKGASSNVVFWTMNCGVSTEGKLRRLFFRVPESRIVVERKDQASSSSRIIPDLFVSPVIGSQLPDNVARFAELFQQDRASKGDVTRIRFEGPGLASYASTCQGQWLAPVY
jgi:hypothetical protein